MKNISGEYFVKCKPVELDSHAKDQVSAQMLWDKSAEMCTLSKELEL